MTVAVLACGDDPSVDAADVTAIAGLCRSPARLSDVVTEEERIVLVLHEGQFDLAAVQKAMRSVGIDPLGAQILEMPEETAIDVPLALAGLRARALAFAGSEPDHAKPVPRREVTRRGLLSPPQHVYVSAPLVDEGRCVAADGCRACSDVCPRDAYRWHRGRIHFNKDVCEPCGRCVAVCPTDAIGNAAATPEMLEAQVRELVDRSDTGVRIRFACSDAGGPTRLEGWQSVVVPCTGMVPGTWLVATLLLGAAAVALPGCDSTGCRLGLEAHSARAVDFARSALMSAGCDERRVSRQAVEEPDLPAMTRAEIREPFTRMGEVATMLALDELANEPLRLTHEGASHGVVTIDAAACTLCAQCAQVCPTDAIASTFDASNVALTFDASRCTFCRQCTIACPEIAQGAIGVSGTFDAAMVRSGRTVINEGRVVMCESCGRPVAPASMMDRIGQMLGEGFEETMSYLTSRCIDCRGLA